jgi:hypothetical protein
MTLKEQILKRAEFDEPTEGSTFHDTIINLSIAHTLRDNPAWTYSIEDAIRGASLENARLRPLIEALAECVAASFGLKNELSALLSAHEDAIRADGGNTNMACLLERLRYFETLLQKLDEL